MRPNSPLSICALAALLCGAGVACTATQERPSIPGAVAPFSSREEVHRALSARDYCLRETQRAMRQESYSPCGIAKISEKRRQAGMVIVKYDSEARLISAQRLEWHENRHAAKDRFSELVAEQISKHGAPSPEAKRYYQKPPTNPLDWKCWMGTKGASVSCITLYPRRAQNAPAIVEDLAALLGELDTETLRPAPVARLRGRASHD